MHGTPGTMTSLLATKPLTFYDSGVPSEARVFTLLITQVIFCLYKCQVAWRKKKISKETVNKSWIHRQLLSNLTNWRLFFMRLSCYWSWIRSDNKSLHSLWVLIEYIRVVFILLSVALDNFFNLFVSLLVYILQSFMRSFYSFLHGI